MEAPETGWVALSSTSLHLFLQGADCGSFLEARKAACGSHQLTWLTGAGQGSVVLGEEAVSFSDPCAHRQVAQQSPEPRTMEQVLRVRAGLVVSWAEPSWGQKATSSFDPPLPPTPWVAFASPHFIGP